MSSLRLALNIRRVLRHVLPASVLRHQAWIVGFTRDIIIKVKQDSGDAEADTSKRWMMTIKTPELVDRTGEDEYDHIREQLHILDRKLNAICAYIASHQETGTHSLHLHQQQLGRTVSGALGIGAGTGPGVAVAVGRPRSSQLTSLLGAWMKSSRRRRKTRILASKKSRDELA